MTPPFNPYRKDATACTKYLKGVADGLKEFRFVDAQTLEFVKYWEAHWTRVADEFDMKIHATKESPNDSLDRETRD